MSCLGAQWLYEKWRLATLFQRLHNCFLAFSLFILYGGQLLMCAVTCLQTVYCYQMFWGAFIKGISVRLLPYLLLGTLFMPSGFVKIEQPFCYDTWSSRLITSHITKAPCLDLFHGICEWLRLRSLATGWRQRPSFTSTACSLLPSSNSHFFSTTQWWQIWELSLGAWYI